VRNELAKKSQKKAASSTVTVRLDSASKTALAKAARLRGVSVSDYVRIVTVPQARREVASAREQSIALTPEEQLAFWHALQTPAELTLAQRELAVLMQGKPKARKGKS
jgi:uncharacterized protein (DUF1778 family)